MRAAFHDVADRTGALARRLRRLFDARARRERLLLIGAAVAVAWMLAESLWLTPAFNAWSAARSRESASRTTLTRLQDDLARRVADARGAEQQLRGEVAQWRERVARGDENLRALGATLVNAPQMVPMLDRLLAQVGGLRLRSMRSLGRIDMAAAGEQGAAAAGAKPATAAAASAEADAHAAGTLYRHGVELTVEGSYADILAYLRAIESMPQRVLGGGLQLKVERHPSVVMTLRLYTLSQDRGWLEI